MTGEDGRCLVDSGAKGMIVSNHGARYIDTTLASIEMLPETVDAVAGKIEVCMDGDIRRGTNIVKALALGTRAALDRTPAVLGRLRARRIAPPQKCATIPPSTI